MTRFHRWLIEEIGSWRNEGLISPEQAKVLTARYAAEGPGREWGLLVLTGLGSVVFGLGIILFFAYNWEGMHRFAKLGTVAIGLVGVHGLGAWLRRQGSDRRGLGEALHLLGTMLFGAGIWLVAQIYHLDEHYPNAFLAWGLAALAMAWALPSLAHGLLALALVFIWSWSEVFDFHQPNHWGAWLVAAGIIPLAWTLRSRVLLFFSLGLFLVLYAFSLLKVDDDLVVTALFLLAGGYLGLARAVGFSRFPDSAGVFETVGMLVYLVLLFLFSFGEVDAGLLRELPEGALAWFYWSIPLLVLLGGWGLMLLYGRPWTQARLDLLETALIGVTLLLVLLASLGASLWSWLLFNLLFLAHGSLFLLQGLSQIRWQPVALGCLMLGGIIFARFLDLFDSLLLRALVFVLLGVGLVLVGQLYARRKQREVRDA